MARGFERKRERRRVEAGAKGGEGMSRDRQDTLKGINRGERDALHFGGEVEREAQKKLFFHD